MTNLASQITAKIFKVGLYFINVEFFIAMEIVQFGMENPNSMDVKLGCQSYLPDAPSKKRNMEESKYLWRRQLGFFITGLNVDGSFYDRNHGSSLNPANVYEKGGS